MTKDREVYTLGLVLLGNFNPTIITPFWLSGKGFIRDSEAEAANVEIIHPEITRFELDWFTFEATPDRIDFKTKRESHFSALKDLVVSVLSALKETPVFAFGLNHLSHFSFKNEKEYENFGYWLSPVQEFSDAMYEPKVLQVQYTETKRDTDEGLLRLVISPSDLILDKKSVVFNTNHHFENKKGDAKVMIEILLSKWDFSFSKANDINNLVWNKAKY